MFMVNTVGKDTSVALKSYIAGFLDADGAIMAPVERHKEKKFKLRIRVIVRVTQKDREILLMFKESLGIGQVVPDRSCFNWIIRDQNHVKWLLEILLPYICVKRKQALIGLKIISSPRGTKEDLVKIALLADSLSSLNVRSKLAQNSYSLKVQNVFSRND